MRVLRLIIIFLSVFNGIFAIKLNDLDFDKSILKGDAVEKIFIIENNSNEKMRYIFTIENEKVNKNIEIDPKRLLLLPHEKKEFKIKIKGDKYGEKNYFLVIDEKSLNLLESDSQVKINRKYRIEQSYIVK